MTGPWRGAVVGILLAGVVLGAETMAGAALQPFPVFNQGPLILPFSLPAPGDWRIAAPGKTAVSLAVDLANTFTDEQTAREELLLDGESWRTTLAVRRGIGGKGELGCDLPIMGIGGGTFDSFIQEWHGFFGLPQGGRESAPKQQLHYRYQRDGVTRLNVTQPSGGLGDLRLTGGWQLQQDETKAVALRGSVSLPTGNSGALRGSGAPGGALWLTAGVEQPVSLGRLGAWGSLGGMLLGRGEIIAEQQRSVVGFGTVGVGWAPAEFIDFKLQLNGNSPLYGGSDLAPLSGYGAMLVMGGALHLLKDTAMVIAVSEDLHVGTAADVALHLSVATTF